MVQITVSLTSTGSKLQLCFWLYPRNSMKRVMKWNVPYWRLHSHPEPHFNTVLITQFMHVSCCYKCKYLKLLSFNLCTFQQEVCEIMQYSTNYCGHSSLITNFKQENINATFLNFIWCQNLQYICTPLPFPILVPCILVVFMLCVLNLYMTSQCITI